MTIYLKSTPGKEICSCFFKNADEANYGLLGLCWGMDECNRQFSEISEQQFERLVKSGKYGLKTVFSVSDPDTNIEMGVVTEYWQ